MSYIIVQESRELIRSRQVAAAAELQNVRLTDAQVRLSFQPEELEPPLKLRLRVRSAGTISAPQRLQVRLRFWLLATDAKERKRPVLYFRCGYAADYALAQGASPKASEIHAFARGNAVFNCWPYFRELVQNASARLGLPPLTVPLFKVRVAEERGGKAERHHGRDARAADKRGAQSATRAGLTPKPC